ncbi:hypothetical protein WH47_06249 [Habropoda laboriosa]|uniref:Histone-lysine N-methyltransferase SETMAR n=1 Tax=Habropoda laboriosa TaxID=597456 RepID=A0A0L7RK53_9HYME|nr:hypothetical protein WH47_06249 [Habropoda laboriosa]
MSELLGKVHNTILKERWVKIPKISKLLIPNEQTFYILTKESDMKKLSTRWRYLHHFKKNKMDYVKHLHTNMILMVKMNKMKYNFLPHLPHSPNLAATDFHLYP